MVTHTTRHARRTVRRCEAGVCVCVCVCRMAGVFVCFGYAFTRLVLFVCAYSTCYACVGIRARVRAVLVWMCVCVCVCVCVLSAGVDEVCFMQSCKTLRMCACVFECVCVCA